MTHYVYPTESGADCSCGKEFNVWKWQSRPGDTSNDIAKRKHLARANANRHADAANAREAREGRERFNAAIMRSSPKLWREDEDLHPRKATP